MVKDTIFDDAEICNAGQGQRQAGQYHETNPVKLYPNPATDQLTLEFEVAIEEEHEFTLYSVTGQQQTRHLLSEGQKSFTIGLGNTPPGLYFYKIRKNGKHFTSGKITIIKL